MRNVSSKKSGRTSPVRERTTTSKVSNWNKKEKGKTEKVNVGDEIENRDVGERERERKRKWERMCWDRETFDKDIHKGGKGRKTFMYKMGES